MNQSASANGFAYLRKKVERQRSDRHKNHRNFVKGRYLSKNPKKGGVRRSQISLLSTETWIFPTQLGKSLTMANELNDPIPDDNDRELVHRFVAGDRDAATEIYHRYARRLRALADAQCSTTLASRIEADDIVQSVFRSFFRRASEGDYDVPQGEELWRLLLVIALHKIRDSARLHSAAKRDARRTVSGGDSHLLSVESPDEQPAVVLRMVVDEILGRLSESNRHVIELRIQGLEIAEISDRLGRSKRSVERILQGFRETIARQLCEDA